jgi:hypothetical protein
LLNESVCLITLSTGEPTEIALDDRKNHLFFAKIRIYCENKAILEIFESLTGYVRDHTNAEQVNRVDQ